MAEAIWKQTSNGDWDVVSAGSDPAGYVHPLAVRAMHEVGVDIGSSHSKHVSQFADQPFDVVVTVCDSAAEACPTFPNAGRMLHWSFEDPAQAQGSDDEKMWVFRRIRDQISSRIREYLAPEANCADGGKDDVGLSDDEAGVPNAPGESAASALDTEAHGEFLDRDLSWLEFNRRVLALAADARTPLMGRVLFLSIFTSNLDEFFMKRVGRKGDRVVADADGTPRTMRLEALRQVILPMLQEQARIFRDEVRPALTENGIHLLGWDEMTDAEQAEANEYFRKNVFPALTPQAVDPSHPFPFISNLSDSLTIALRYPNRDRDVFARVKVPHQLPQWIELHSEGAGRERRLAGLREIVVRNLHLLFPGMTILHVLPVRVTRSAEVDADAQQADDLLEQVEEELRQRRLQHVVRLEHGASPNDWLLKQVLSNLDLRPDQVFEMPGELDYTDYLGLLGLGKDELQYPSWTPTLPASLARSEDIFSTIRRGDVMVHHPYESFDASVSRFIRSAVDDDNCVAIKMTLYRTSDDTPFVPWLIEAAEEGKQVVCLVELKARFDEHRNIRWANALEHAGVHVVYGMVGKKTHTKTALVVRKEADGLRCYAHIGTGNYHPKTARLYTDLGLFTCDPDLAADVAELFHFLTGASLKMDYRKLLVAPVTMKTGFLELIDEEIKTHRAGRPAHIIAKMNQLEDRDVCRALYRASQAGVPIDLIVRGFCILRPGVPELSPTIRVISIVGRFLEHSRIYYFRSGAEDAQDGRFFIGSADWMRRNLEDRVEAVAPIEAPALRERLWGILQLLLHDQRLAWDMHPDGDYTHRQPALDASPTAAMGTHDALMEDALQRQQR